VKQKYRICQLVPPGWDHLPSVREVVLGLEYSFESLGYDCDVTINQFSRDRMNIFLGYPLLKDAYALEGVDYIVYQLEQLSELEGYHSESRMKVLAGATCVWDYSQQNVTFLKQRNIQAKYLPIGYHERLEVIPRQRQDDLDVLFFGAISDRRRALLQVIQNTPSLRLRTMVSVYGAERDAWIARSRMVLNIHQFDKIRLLESPRIAYLLNNRCFVLSESSSDNPYPTIDLKFGELNELLEMCQYYAAAPAEIDRLAHESYGRFKQDYPMVELLKAVL
jgi:hypothetical protein